MKPEEFLKCAALGMEAPWTREPPEFFPWPSAKPHGFLNLWKKPKKFIAEKLRLGSPPAHWTHKELSLKRKTPPILPGSKSKKQSRNLSGKSIKFPLKFQRFIIKANDRMSGKD